MANRKPLKGAPVVAPEERGRGEPRIKRGRGEGFDGGGFAEGTHGRGPTPFEMRHSAKPGGHSAEAHMATSGRGGDGVFGRSKGASGDALQPQSHAEFESLGATHD